MKEYTAHDLVGNWIRFEGYGLKYCKRCSENGDSIWLMKSEKHTAGVNVTFPFTEKVIEVLSEPPPGNKIFPTMKIG